jgi:hypothetical protein
MYLVGSIKFLYRKCPGGSRDRQNSEWWSKDRGKTVHVLAGSRRLCYAALAREVRFPGGLGSDTNRVYRSVRADAAVVYDDDNDRVLFGDEAMSMNATFVT